MKKVWFLIILELFAFMNLIMTLNLHILIIMEWYIIPLY